METQKLCIVYVRWNANINRTEYLDNNVFFNANDEIKIFEHLLTGDLSGHMTSSFQNFDFDFQETYTCINNGSPVVLRNVTKASSLYTGLGVYCANKYQF